MRLQHVIRLENADQGVTAFLRNHVGRQDVISVVYWAQLRGGLAVPVLLGELGRESPEARVIVITANGSINRAVQAMRAGAFDFLVKPFDGARLLSAVANAGATLAPLGDEAEESPAAGFQGFIGRSPPMDEIYRMVRSIGRSTATVSRR